jgi:hypothetical protein
MQISWEALRDAGLVLGLFGGGVVLGVTKIIPLRRSKNLINDFPKLKKLEALELSEHTSGTKHISEEGLSKYKELVKKIDTDCMSIKSHDLICAKEKSDMKLYISDTMGVHTEMILKEIRNVRTYRAAE